MRPGPDSLPVHQRADRGADRRADGRLHPPGPAPRAGHAGDRRPRPGPGRRGVLHLVAGKGLALGYAGTFALLDRATWWPGALLGGIRTAVLVAGDGTIDWCCLPGFDGTPVFASLVGGPGAGRFRMGPPLPAGPPARRYRGDIATVETTWATSRRPSPTPPWATPP
ncbi:trehalase-like domain-containing protein [Kocuria arenosa]|uniref:trehalase-like domain-containing protein n=1 Tax=Kocuria arenosa TaxID=3071446 RepID=UPI0034D414AA